jgi:hypothetical protein
MAKNKDQNEDPEEEKKDNQFEEDDDFGLPDLDYDELEEEADQLLEEEAPEIVSEIKSETETPSGDIKEDALGEDWEKEMEDELEEDLASGKFEEETEAFYEEESFDEFESEIEKESVGSSVFGIDDNPKGEVEIESNAKVEDSFYSTSDEPKAEKIAPDAQYSQYLDENQGSKGKFARTVVLGTILFTVVGFAIYFLWGSTASEEPKKEVAKVEVIQPEPTPEVEAKVAEPVETKKPIKASKAAANVVAAGQITSLSERTGKSYLIIGSFFDGDMAQDYADKLSIEGKSPFIIPPFKDHRFYRVAIAEYNNFNDASANIESYKQEYGADVWPLRY